MVGKARKRRTDRETRRLFAEPQKEMFDDSDEERVKRDKPQKVECLGVTFDSELERRGFFLQRLKEKLQDPEFRKTPGFPIGTDEAILRMSDPPYYTACPNPFLQDFVRTTDRDRSKDPPYHREPFAVDVSVGKTDPLYKAHSYHTKVPHLAIVPSILHYTEPGDLVLDGFCGSGMTGVAAQFCGTASTEYRTKLDAEWKNQGRLPPKWGVRRSVQGDLSPAATFIAANCNLPFALEAFVREGERILQDLGIALGWMYETTHTDKKKSKGRINYTVWSEVFACSECSKDIVFLDEALDATTKRVAHEIRCPSCGATATKEQMELRFETYLDHATNKSERRPKRVPVLVNYSVGGRTYEKRPGLEDLDLLKKIAALPTPVEVTTSELPDCQMTRVGRMRTTNVRRVHHMFLPRAAQSLGFLWRMAEANEDRRLRNMLLYVVEQAVWGMSVLARYVPTHYSQVNQYLSGVLYVASQIVEVSPWYILEGKLKRLRKALAHDRPGYGVAAVTTGDCARIPIPDCSADYIFTDPPFGENIYYADLNYVVESWHKVVTAPDTEAIIDRVRRKELHEYQSLMHACFREYHRVLKPGRWMTVVFSNASNAVWRAIQEAMGAAGFVVADVRTLDKQQGSFRQVTSSAVKQDLVISAYKPTARLEEEFALREANEQRCWDFVTEHLRNLPVFAARVDEMEVLVERTGQMLQDRMIAFHVQHGVAVPLSAGEFLQGLAQRFPVRDGMYFLAEQVAEYDKKRARIDRLRQLSLFVNDEATAIQWLRQELQQKPQSFQDLQPRFMKEQQSWADHEQMIELKDILRENFLVYDGSGPVPAQIHSYLSTNFKDCRSLGKSDARLKAKAVDRWYVPDPGKQGDLEALRSRRLLTEFEQYKTGKERKLKEFRTEAVRAGFKAAYDAQDYETIVRVAEKLPENVLQEDEKLLMYYDVASTRLGV